MENLIDKVTFGDFYELIKQVPDKSVDLCVTDPPYEIHAESGGGLHKTRDWLKNVHEDDIDHFEPIEFLEEMKRVLKVFNAYIFCSKALFTQYIEWFEANGYNWDWIVFSKVNPIPTKNYKYLPDREMCFFVREKGAYFNNDVEDFKKYLGVKRITVKSAKYHSTEKDLKSMEGFIEISSKPGSLVIDPFMGSGTTAIACQNLGRRFLGFEKNRKNYDNCLKKMAGISHKINLEDTFMSLLDEC